MKWATVLVVLAAGCGALEPQPENAFEAILTVCPFTRESTLQSIEVAEELRNLGVTFSDQVGFLDESDCGRIGSSCRECNLAVFEWVYFGLLP